MNNLSKLQSEAVLEFKSKYPKYKYLCRYSDDFKKGEWINIEDVFKFYNDQIQKAYEAGEKNGIEKLEVIKGITTYVEYPVEKFQYDRLASPVIVGSYENQIELISERDVYIFNETSKAISNRVEKNIKALSIQSKEK